MLPIFHEAARRNEILRVNQALRNRRRQLRRDFDLNILSNKRFIELFRVNKLLFQYLLERLTPHLRQSRYRSGVTVTQKILVALRFYACGCYQRSIGGDFNLGVSQTSVHRYIKEVTEAINEHLCREFIRFPTTRREINEVKEEFMRKFNFPGVIGAIDGSHIAILKPYVEEHNFINRKGFHSINAQFVADSNLKILAVNANYGGSTHDSFIWRNSEVKNFLVNEYNQGLRRTWLLGDSGYPLQPILMVPFLNALRGSPEARYNYHHSIARNCAEQCYGVLKGRFRCLLKERVARYAPEFVGTLINACSVLHNLCIQYNIDFNMEDAIYEDDINEQYNQGNRRADFRLAEGEIIRRNIVNTYFNFN